MNKAARTRGEWVKGFAIVIVVISIIGGAAAGWYYKAVTISARGTYELTTSYNWPVALAVAVGGSLSSTVFFAIASVIEKQNEIMIEISQLSKQAQMELTPQRKPAAEGKRTPEPKPVQLRKACAAEQSDGQNTVDADLEEILAELDKKQTT